MHVLHHAHIHTLDPLNPYADALAIDQGRIVAIGSEIKIFPLARSPREIEDMQARTILPGFTDSHIHTFEYGRSLSIINCETATKQECLERVASQAACSPVGKWIFGHGWNHNIWPDGIGNARELDAISQQHPIFLTAKSLHAAWVNSTALRLAGIHKETSNPDGGIIRRDSSGNPTGILLESAAKLVEQIIPEPTSEQICQKLLAAQETLLQIGITAIHDVDRWESMQVFHRMRQEGKLKLRVVKSIPRNHLKDAISAGLRTGEGDDWLRIGWLKLFMDGALGPQTASMLEPYKGNDKNLGILYLDTQALYEIGYSAVEHGISLEVHAIGDRANREALNAFGSLDENNDLPKPNVPHRIEHLQLITIQDMERLANLEITASMQPIHATSDQKIAERYWGNRCSYAYAWQSILKTGARLIFGSDAPVESPNPFLGLHAAITRRSSNDPSARSGWYPEQCLTLKEALHAYISEPPNAAGWGDQFGRIEPGAFADLIVLPTDPFKCPEESIETLKPKATMVNGEWVWRS
ncbi:MAG TPA: amidohydrolase [Anaerolineae bacterium]|nr:amidohydrolase [Anaerolineae bacterium]